MPRLAGYKCEKCGHDDEELFGDKEKRPKTLRRRCKADWKDPKTGEISKCGGKLKINDIKNNCHRYKFLDLNGI